jgi:hypothetical protein
MVTEKPDEHQNQELEILPIVIPEYPKASCPFSTGKIRRYKLGDLKKIPSGQKTDRTDWFEKRLMGIWFKIRHPVPYAFRTSNGDPRSLDAGAMAYLIKRSPPDVDPILDPEGYIVELKPTKVLGERYSGMERQLIKAIEPPMNEATNQLTSSTTVENPLSTEPNELGAAEFDFDIDEPPDERRRELSERVVRDGAKKFRQDLLYVWNNKWTARITRFCDDFSAGQQTDGSA